ncbi:hypothetical protein [Streptomyces sp. NPDC002587]
MMRWFPELVDHDAMSRLRPTGLGPAIHERMARAVADTVPGSLTERARDVQDAAAESPR